jgi:hypothetical protein
MSIDKLVVRGAREHNLKDVSIELPRNSLVVFTGLSGSGKSSLAFDTITTFPGRFSQQILPEQLHILNVSFLVPELRREYGGCAGNIAYNLRQLGGEPVIMATLGNDGGDYLERIRSWGVDTSLVTWVQDHYTAQAIIITDTDNNQITAFHPGAMQKAGDVEVPGRADLKVAIIAPDGTAIQTGGKTGPNLYGVIGRTVASGDFNYGDSLKSVGAAGRTWDEAALAAYVANPTAWLKDATGDAGPKSKMTFKLARGGADMAAYLASVAPASE